MRSQFLLFLLFSTAFLSAQYTPYNKTNIIVKFKKEIKIEQYNNIDRSTQLLPFYQLNDQFGLKSSKTLNPYAGSDIYVLTFEETQDIPLVIHQYELSGLFEYVEPDYIGYGGGQLMQTSSITPNDFFFNRQWGLANDGTFNLAPSKAGADIKMQDAWSISQGSSEIIIASLDTGVKLDHPELKNRIWRNPEDLSDGIDNDGNGYLDDFIGWDFANNDKLPHDDYGHGTNVTGIIGSASNNNIGYAGVNWNSSLMILKILNEDNTGFYSWWIEAIYYAVNHGANVLNMSVGGSSFSNAMQDAVKYAVENNVVIVACMMNDNNDVPYYPAAYQETIAVGATDPNDERSINFPWNPSKGSNFGDHIDIAAPGNYIFGLAYNSNTNFNTYWAGTSQATPLVTGVVSLIQSVNPNLNPEEIRQILRATADDQVGRENEDIEGWDKFHGAGRLNAFKALTLTTGTNEPAKEIKTRWVYPNPLRNDQLLFIENNNEKMVFIEIMNILGESIYAQKHFGNPIEIRPNIKLPGHYVLQIITENHERITFKILIH